jgi:hypothetical protein
MPAEGYDQGVDSRFQDFIGQGGSPGSNLRDAFAQMMLQQYMQRGDPLAQDPRFGGGGGEGLPPFNGKGEQGMPGAASDRDMQQGQGLPPFNGMGEQGLPQAGGAMMPQGPQSPMPQQQQQMGQPPMGTPGGAPSPQDLMALQQLMKGAASNNDMRQMKPPGAYSLPPSPGAGRFNI